LKAADLLAIGIATGFVTVERWADLEAAICAADLGDNAESGIAEILSNFASYAGEATLAQHFEAIDHHFGHDDIEAVIASVYASQSDFAAETAKFLSKKSPTSLKLSFAQLHAGRGMSFNDCMIMEYRLSQACMKGKDFYEGIRAVLVDKDHNPVWNPAHVADVNDDDIAACFDSLGDQDLVL
jgi:enoyl-CoA hydratase/carnithine racemase